MKTQKRRDRRDKEKKRKEKGEGRPKEEKKKKPRRLPTERRVNAEKGRKIIEGDNCLIVPEVFINFLKIITIIIIKHLFSTTQIT